MIVQDVIIPDVRLIIWVNCVYVFFLGLLCGQVIDFYILHLMSVSLRSGIIFLVYFLIPHLKHILVVSYFRVKGVDLLILLPWWLRWSDSQRLDSHWVLRLGDLQVFIWRILVWQLCSLIGKVWHWVEWVSVWAILSRDRESSIVSSHLSSSICIRMLVVEDTVNIKVVDLRLDCQVVLPFFLLLGLLIGFEDISMEP